MSAAEVRLMMRRHGLTIRSMARRFQITMKKVRESRINGGSWEFPLLVGIMAHERTVALNTPMGYY